MNNFIKKSLYFSIPILLFVLIFDLFLRNLNTIYIEKKNGLEQNLDSTEILVLGNSHATYGINPNLLSLKAYNLACVDQSLYFDKRLTLKYLDKLQNLKTVLISVDYHSLYFSKQENGARDIWSYYANGIKYKNIDYLKYNISPFIFGYKPKVSFSVLKGSLKEWVRNEEANLFFFPKKGVKKNSKLENGYVAYESIDESKFNEKEYFNKAKAFTRRVNQSTENTEIIQDLSDFVKILKAKNITPILISIPCYNEFTKKLDTKIIERNNNQIKSITKKYNIEYWDYLNSDLFTKSDFYNPDHLNKKGAKKFSTILNKKLMKM